MRSSLQDSITVSSAKFYILFAMADFSEKSRQGEIAGEEMRIWRGDKMAALADGQ